MGGSTIVVLALSVAVPLGGAAHRKTEQGNRLYEDGALADALRAYTEAQVHAPEAPELYYDLGNVLYRQGDYEGASEAFTRALLSGSGDLVGSAAYNLGNALYRQDEYREAADSYIRALRADPADTDAKRNLELALRALEQQPPSQKPQPDENGEPQDQQSGSSSQPKPSSSEDQSGDEDEGSPQPSDGDETTRDTSPGEAEAEDGRMTEEQARRMLDGTQDEELDNLRNHALQEIPRATRAAEEDW